MKKNKFHLSSFHFIVFGFALLILGGTLLLMLPVSSAKGEATTFWDALLTATSASCVTGLVVFDTATYWSFFGQIVIISLIQIGGLGIVTLFLSFLMLSGLKIGLVQRRTLQDSVSAPELGGVVGFTKFILAFVFSAELVGAVLLAFPFCHEFGFGKGLWYSVFHSVSAFCNAGFDLMGVKTPFSSLTHYVGDVWVNTVVMLLIVVGGLGFLTWQDIKKNRHHIRKYRMQSKLVLVVTAFLLIVPAVYYYFFEISSMDLSPWEKIIASLFQSVTTRTAGMNTVDFDAMSEGGKLVTIGLMLVGGAPGSTAGGMKVTTLGVLVVSAVAVFKRRQSPECFGRRLPVDIVTTAAAIFLLYLSFALAGAVIISRVEDIPLLTALFETASAVGTVGLTLGVTPGLGTVSKIIVTLMMFFGRVGGLTFVYVFMSGKVSQPSRLPEERIIVG